MDAHGDRTAGRVLGPLSVTGATRRPWVESELPCMHAAFVTSLLPVLRLSANKLAIHESRPWTVLVRIHCYELDR